jgi:hypothetical protein
VQTFSVGAKNGLKNWPQAFCCFLSSNPYRAFNIAGLYTLCNLRNLDKKLLEQNRDRIHSNKTARPPIFFSLQPVKKVCALHSFRFGRGTANIHVFSFFRIISKHRSSSSPRFSTIKARTYMYETFKNRILSRVARWYMYFQTKIAIWINFGRPFDGRCYNILWPFGLFYSHLIYCIAVWYIMC